MSRDQRPGKVRLVGTEARVPQTPPNAVPAVDAAGRPAGSSGTVKAGGEKRSPVLLMLLFLLGCVGGGAGIAALSHAGSMFQ